MTKNVIAAVVGSMCALLLCEPHSFGQSLSGTSLEVTGTSTLNALVATTGTIGVLSSGTATLNMLEVAGMADFQNNTLLLGTSGTNPGLIIAYDDGTNGVNSSITLQSTRPASVWNWQRLTASGSTTTAMQLDASNRLILTGTAATNPPQLVMDPNGAISVNGSNLITQQAADNRYVVNGGATETTLRNTTISGTATINGGLIVSGNATVNGSTLLTQITADSLYLSGRVLNVDDSGDISNPSTRPGVRLSIQPYGNLTWFTNAWDGCIEVVNNTNSEKLDLGIRQGQHGFVQVQNLPYLKIECSGGGLAKLRAEDCGVGDMGWEFAVLNADGSASFAGDGSGNFLAKIDVTGSAVFSGLAVTGTSITVTTAAGNSKKIVAINANQSVLVPEQGDLSMGDFINGAQPPDIDTQTIQQSLQQNSTPRQTMQSTSGVPGADNNTMSSGTMQISASGTAIIR